MRSRGRIARRAHVDHEGHRIARPRDALAPRARDAAEELEGVEPEVVVPARVPRTLGAALEDRRHRGAPVADGGDPHLAPEDVERVVGEEPTARPRPLRPARGGHLDARGELHELVRGRALREPVIAEVEERPDDPDPAVGEVDRPREGRGAHLVPVEDVVDREDPVARGRHEHRRRRVELHHGVDVPRQRGAGGDAVHVAHAREPTGRVDLPVRFGQGLDRHVEVRVERARREEEREATVLAPDPAALGGDDVGGARGGAGEEEEPEKIG